MLLRHFILAFLLSNSLVAFAKTDSTQQLQNVKTEIKSLNQDVNKKTASKERLFKQLKQQSRAISKLNNTLLKLKKTINTNTTELGTLENKVKKQNSIKSHQLDALGKQIRSAYFQGKPSFIKVLLNQHDPATLARGTQYFHYFHQARQQQLLAINELLSHLSQEQKQLFSVQKKQQQLYKKQHAEQQKLQHKAKQRKLTLKQLDADISSKKERLAQLHQQEKSLNNLISRLKKTTAQAQKPASFNKQHGHHAWPLKGKVLAHYGSARNIGKLKWKGILISAKAGKDVNAAATGDIIFADWLRGFGLLVIIDHGKQYMTLYGNNETLLKQVGDHVMTGDLIAKSGDKGVRQHSGLYFEVRYKGKPTDPIKWLQKKTS